MEEDIKEIQIIINSTRGILQKDIKPTDEDVYSIDGRQFIAIENLLKAYKEMETLNKGHEEEIGRLEYCYEKALDDLTKTFKDNIPKSKVKEKLEPVIDSLEKDGFVGYADEIREIEILETLEEE